VKTPKKTKLFAIINPTSIKIRPLKVKCAYNVFKNWPLGHGQYRISGNLGALVPMMMDARSNGYDDVLWLLDDYIKEMTVLNVFALLKSRYGELELVTPPNDGCIFNGVERRTIIDLAKEIQKEKGVKVVEKQISIHELINADKEERLLEFFGGATSSGI
jgi:branched-chain amino acid aminotransferase